MLEIFQYEFMQNAYLVWFFLGILWPLLWIFLILKKYSFITDTLSHISLSGAILWFLSQIQPLIVTLGYSILSAILIEKLRLSKKISWDVILTLILAGNLAFISLMMWNMTQGFFNLSSYLFGSIALVSKEDVYIIISTSILLISILLFWFKLLLKISYDEDNMIAKWVWVKNIQIFFMIWVASFITIAIPITWVLLISSIMILPVISAMQISWSLRSTLIIAEILSIISIFTGITLSYFFNLSASGITTFFLLCCFFIFYISKIFKKVRQ